MALRCPSTQEINQSRTMSVTAMSAIKTDTTENAVTPSSVAAIAASMFQNENDLSLTNSTS
jgi:hypothetical protein